LILVTTIVVTAMKYIVKRRHAKWVRTLPLQTVHAIELQQQADKQMERALNESTSSMLTTPEISRTVRIAVPIIILANVAFFISGHASIAAEVGFVFEIAGEDFKIQRLFEFTIMGSTIGMWNAGAREMSIFIMVFSVIWPYTKQFVSLLCWCLPPGRLSISTRGSTFLILDALAKWSIVDIFVMLISMVAFRLVNDGSTAMCPFCDCFSASARLSVF
jgi:Paraquat-inducible protein A